MTPQPILETQGLVDNSNQGDMTPHYPVNTAANLQRHKLEQFNTTNMPNKPS